MDILDRILEKGTHKPSVDELFSAIEGHEGLKEILYLKLYAEKQISVILMGPPATAKSLFLREIEKKMPNAYYFSGTTISGKGLIQFIDTHRNAKILCIDEIDKVSKREQACLYELLETGRVIYTTGKLKLNFMMENIKIIATSNSIEKLAKPFQSRFHPLHLEPYTYEQFVKIAVRLLKERYELLQEISITIAKVVWNVLDSRDVRMLLHVGVLITNHHTEQDIERIVTTLQKYHKVTETDYNG